MSEKCTDNCPLFPRVDALERANEQHSQTHREMYGRLNSLERISDVQENKLTTIDEKLDEIQTGQKNILSKVEALEVKPGKRWETLVACVISALGSAFAMWLAMGMPGVVK